MNQLIVALAALAGSIAFAQTGPKGAGHWEGKIQTPNREVGVVIDLAKNAKGAWIGSMTAAGTPLVDLPLTDVNVDDAGVRFQVTMPPQPARFTGKLSEDGKTLSGTVSGPAGDAPFHLTRTGEPNVKEPPPSSAMTKEFEGAWEGVLSPPGATLRLALKLSAGPGGAATGALNSLDQGSMDIPITSISIQGKELRFEIRVISGSYRGTLGANGEIAGEWSQGGNSLPLSFKRPAAKQQP